MASDTADMVRSAIPTGFIFFRIVYRNILLNEHNISSEKI
jgi:hypothetical protein